MTTAADQQLTVEQVQASFQSALADEPVYAKMLTFFESIYELQTAAIGVVRPSKINLSPEIVHARRTGEMPLIERSEITLDQVSAKSLLQSILTVAQSANRQLSAAAELLKTYFKGDENRLAHCQQMFLDKDRDGLQRLCDDIGINTESLDFFLYNSLWPSLASHTRKLSAEHTSKEKWTKGYCPICGALPKISFLVETGGRFLSCRFCRHEWSFGRIQCPFCSNDDTASIGYYISDDDKAHRIDTCDRCKNYIINVDTRRLSRVFYAPLEALVSTHLDIKAEQMGYRQAVDLNYADLSPGVL